MSVTRLKTAIASTRGRPGDINRTDPPELHAGPDGSPLILPATALCRGVVQDESLKEADPSGIRLSNRAMQGWCS